MTSWILRIGVLLAASACNGEGKSGGAKPADPTSEGGGTGVDQTSSNASVDDVSPPVEINGSFLNECVLTEVDEKAQQVRLGCATPRDSGRLRSDLTWKVVDAGGAEVGATRVAVPASPYRFDEHFALPAERARLEALSIVATTSRGESATFRLADLESSKGGEELDKCLAKNASNRAFCYLPYNRPVDFATRFVCQTRPERCFRPGNALERVQIDGEVRGLVDVPVLIGRDTVGIDYVCGPSGIIERSTVFLGVHRRDGWSFDPKGDAKTSGCFSEFRVSPVLYRGALRYSSRLIGGPVDANGEPYCFFALLNNERFGSFEGLVIFENPNAITATTPGVRPPLNGKDEIRAERLQALVDKHRCTE